MFPSVAWTSPAPGEEPSVLLKLASVVKAACSPEVEQVADGFAALLSINSIAGDGPP
jgi:hypothetical protein